MRGARGHLPPELAAAVDRQLSDLALPKQLQELRRARGLKQKDVAERLGSAWQRVAALETGKRTNLQLRSILAYALALGARVTISIDDSTVARADFSLDHRPVDNPQKS